MVFESLLVDILNRYLKPYVKKIDSSNLNIGVWNGNVHLKQLELKEDVLSEANVRLPVTIGTSYVEELSLKVPWKKLARDPTVVTVSGVYLVLTPNTSGTHDYAKEKKREREAKQKKLKVLEDAKKKSSKDKDKDEDSFFLKLGSHIVKNLLVKVQDIHIRFEDSVTVPGRTFAAGITLDTLEVKTTTSSWVETVVKEAVTYAYKLVELNSLAVYFDPETQPVLLLPQRSLVTTMKEGICRKTKRVDHSYVLRPLTVYAKVQMNLKPETDMTTPQVSVAVECRQADLDFSKTQYESVLTVSQAMDVYFTRLKYVKHRPRVPFKGNIKLWWKFAYNSILDEQVKPKLEAWSWVHMKTHRDYCRLYTKKYLEKLKSVHVSSALEKELEALEDVLDVFNIMLCRQLAHQEKRSKKDKRTKGSASRPLRSSSGAITRESVQGPERGATDAETPEETTQGLLPPPPDGGGGRAVVQDTRKSKKGFFTSVKDKLKHGGTKKTVKSTKAVAGGVVRSDRRADADGREEDEGEEEEHLSKKELELLKREEEERKRFLEDIGYGEGMAEVEFPPEYIGHVVTFIVEKVNLRVTSGDEQILHASVKGIEGRVDHRPSSGNLCVAASVNSFTALGVPTDGDQDTLLISSHVGELMGPLLSVSVEKSPLDKSVDLRVYVNALPVKIIYEADTVDALIGAFKVQDVIHFRELTDAATASVSELRLKAKKRLEVAIQQRKLLDVAVTWQSPYIIIPQSGSMSKDSSLIVVSLGHLLVSSDRQTKQSKADTCSLKGGCVSLTSEFDAYDTFKVELTGLQALVVPAGANWLKACQEKCSPYHIVPSTGMELTLQRSILKKDAFLPSLQLSGTIHKVPVVLREDQLLLLLQIVLSLPLPPPSLTTNKKAVYSDLPVAKRPTSPTVTEVQTALGSMYPIDTTDTSDSDSLASTPSEIMTGAILKATLPDTLRRGLSDSSSALGDLADNLNVSQVIFTQLIMKLTLQEVSLDLKKCGSDGKVRDFLHAEVKTIAVELTERTWDRQGTLRIGSVDVVDYFTQVKDDRSVQVVESEEGADGNFATVAFTMVDTVLGKEFAEKYTGLTNSATALLSRLNITLHSGTIATLLELLISLLPALRQKSFLAKLSLTKDRPTVAAESAVRSASSMDFQLEVDFSGVHLEVLTHKDMVTAVDVRGLNVSGSVGGKRATVDAVVKSLSVLGAAQKGGKLQKMVFSEDEKMQLASLHMTKFNWHRPASSAPAPPDLSKLDAEVVLYIHKLRVMVLQPVIEGALDFVADVHIDKLLTSPDFMALMELAAQAAAEKSSPSPQLAVVPVQERPKKSTPLFKASLNLSAPVIILPMALGGGVVLDLGDVSLNAAPEYKNDSTVAALVAKVQLSAAQLYSVSDVSMWGGPEVDREYVMKPVQGQAQLMWAMWKQSSHVKVPTLSVTGNMETLEATLTLAVINNMVATAEQAVMLLTSPSMESIQQAVTNNAKMASGQGAEALKNVITKGGRVRREEPLSVDINVNLSSGRLLLKTSVGEDNLLSGVISELGIGTRILMKSNLPQVDTRITLRDVYILDHEREPPAKVVSSRRRSEKMLEMELSVVTQVAAAPREEAGMVIPPAAASIKIRVVPLQVLLTAGLGLRVIDFVRNINIPKIAVKKAVAMTKEATTAAARLAKDQHIDLDVVVEAPLICVPLPLPNQALVVNMGVLTLKNQCLKESIVVKGSEEEEEQTIESVFERFTIALDDFSINRSVGVAQSSPEKSFVLEFKQSRTLWDPGHIRCTVSRHMCYWMQEVPQLKALLHLGSLRLSLGTEDLDLFLEFALDTAQRVKEANLLPVKRASGPVVQGGAAAVAAGHESIVGPTVDKSLLFKGDFRMDSFTFNFYCGEPSLSDVASGAYPAECCFARLNVNSIHLDIAVTTSSCLELNAALQSFSVADCRPKVQERPMGNLVIQRYHDSKETKALNRPLLSLSITRIMDSNYLMVKADGLLVVLDVDFTKSLVDILIELLHRNDKLQRLTALGKASEPEVLESCLLETEEVVYEPPPASEQTVQKKDTFKFQLSLQNLRVAIVEDAMKSNPTALLLRAEAFAHLAFDPPKNSLQASLQLSNFGVSACSILEMDNAMTHVLLPLSVSAALFGTVDLQSVDVQVDVSRVSLSISPALVQLIQRVVKTFMPQKKEEKMIQPPPTDLWEVKQVQKTAWFLLSRIREIRIPPKTKTRKDESMEVHVKQVEVKVEGESARPLIALIASASGFVSNWSTELMANFTVHSEVTYYNEALSFWEPILEPVAVQRGKYQPWNFQVQLKMPIAGEYEHILGSKKTDKTVVERVRLEPMLVVDVAARAPLELTVTRSAVNLLKSIVEAYTADVTISSEFSSTAGFRNVSSAPVTVYNKIGKEYEVAVKPGPSFKVEIKLAEEPEEDDFIMVPHLSSLDFFLAPSRVMQGRISVCSTTTSAGTSTVRDSFDLKVPNHEVVRDIGVVNDGVFYFPLTPLADAYKDRTSPLVIQVSSAYGKKLVTVRSCYQVINHLNVEVDLYLSKESSTLKPIAILQPDEAFPFPLAAILHEESFSVIPHGFGFTIDPNSVKISQMQKTVELMCSAPQTGAFFFIRVVPEEEDYADQYEWAPTGGKSHTFHIRPPILLHNLLPYLVDITYEGSPVSTPVNPGQSEPLCLMPTSQDNTLIVKVKSKGQSGLGGRVRLGPLTEPQQCTVLPDLRQSGLHVHYDKEQTSYYNLYLYAPVWVVNNTGQVLAYSVSRSKNEHVHQSDESIFFLPEADESSSVKVCIDHCAGSESTSWSKSISLKAVPSHGNVAVKQFGGEYEVKLGVHLALAKIQLTRVLTIAPYYMLSNQTKEVIYIREEGSPFAPLQVQSGETIPFPVVTDSLKVQVAMQIPSKWSKLFSFNKSHATILRLEGEIKAVIVNVEASEGICTIAFSPYYPGCTPVRVVNLFRATFLEFRQALNKNERKTFLAPGESVEYTWNDPTGSRSIHWSLSNTAIAFAISTSKDGGGSFALPAEALPPHQEGDSDSDIEDVNSEWFDIAMDGSMYLSAEAERGKRPAAAAAGKGRERRESKGYWVSFLDGLQRTLLFTDRYNLIENVRRRNRTSSSLVVANASFRSIGVSVVDDVKKRDILYLGLKESELIWQLRQKGSSKWKTVDEELRSKLEAAYKQDPKAVLKEEELHVNLESMEMLHPVSGLLRRTRHGGLDVEVKVARDLKEFEGHIKSGYIQADNQLPVSLYPIVLHPIPPPPSVGSYALPPFAEARVIMRRTELSNLFLVKYLGAAVENMSVGIDFSLVAALLDMVMPEGEHNVPGDYLEADRKRALVPLKSTVEAEVTSASTQLYIDGIEIAPVKAKVSFSSETIRYFPDLEGKTVNTILGLFSTVTAFQDADFKLAALHIGHEPSSAKKLLALFQKHYVSQSLFQVYAVILGLDVIGNPVSFVRGFTEGTIDLFYEPVKAGIHGDLGEGLLYGGKSFLGGTIGGVAGAGAKVTGSLGNVVAKLTFDKDHQESRIQDKGKQDSSILHRFGGLGKSLFKGVTGVVTQPVKGGKQEGAVGVMKGLGRGTAGLLLKPIGGVIDFTSSNLTSLKNTTSVYATNVERLRQPRFISGTGLHPYSAHEASGLAIFNRLTQGDVYDTKEAVIIHEELEKGCVVLLTNRRVILAEHTSVIDHWRVTQDIDFANMRDMPVIEQNAVIIYYEAAGAVQQMAVTPLKNAEVTVNLGDLIGKAYLRAHSVQC